MASFTENFDGVTAPSVPSTISVDANTWVTSTTSSHSGLNSIRQSPANSVPEFHTVSSGVGADAILTVWFNFIGTWDFTGAFFGIRRQSGTGSGYWACIKQGSSETKSIQLQRRSGGPGGSYSAIGSAVGVTLSTGAWYQIKIVPSGSTIIVRLQRASDSNWLDNTGSWGASEVDTISQTDTTYTSAGEAMVTVYGNSSFDFVYVDDITYADAASAFTPNGVYAILY